MESEWQKSMEQNGRGFPGENFFMLSIIVIINKLVGNS
jgi:hypothetical protein